MAGEKRGASQLTPELAFRLEIQRVVSRGQVRRTAIRTVGAVACVGFAYLAIASMAGTTTIADFGLKIAANLRLSVLLAWGTTAAAIAWGSWERHLRQRTAREMAARINSLEKRLDPDRTSSGLNPQDDPPLLA